VTTGGAAAKRAYVVALASEIDRLAEAPFPHTGFDTVYFGGGTPSSLDSRQIDSILEHLRARVSIDADVTVTLEANPEDVSPERLREWRDLGIDTLSLGVQAFDSDALQFLGRSHSSGRATQSVEWALAADFRAVSVDLIYGLPQQTTGAWSRDLERVVALAPQHLSCYELTIHERTAFGVWKKRGALRPLDSDRAAELFRFTHESLADRGYEGYEVSNFARGPMHRSRHNLKYWRRAPYLGLGPSAHSFDGQHRWWNLRALRHWCSALETGAAPIEQVELLSAEEMAIEVLMLGLRTTAGVDLDELDTLVGEDFARRNETTLARWESAGLISRAGRRVLPTLAGLAVADGLAAQLRLGPSDL
jgi:oxygen-independent coproporphyrinogen-3 oxidase